MLTPDQQGYAEASGVDRRKPAGAQAPAVPIGLIGRHLFRLVPGYGFAEWRLTVALLGGARFGVAGMPQRGRIEVSLAMDDGTEYVHYLPHPDPDRTEAGSSRISPVLEGRFDGAFFTLSLSDGAQLSVRWPFPGRFHGLAHGSPGLRHTVEREAGGPLAEFPPELWRATDARPLLPETDEPDGAERIRDAGVFDPKWYVETYAPAGNPLAHYIARGEARGLRPAAQIRPAIICFEAQRSNLAGTLLACLPAAQSMQQDAPRAAPALTLGLTGISVIVPHYEYARFVPDRFGSILRQSHKVQEVIFLDDGSTDAGVALFEELCAHYQVPARIVQSSSNGGSMLRQWRQGAALASCETVWIAESDDSAHPEFLRQVALPLGNRPDEVLAFCDSQRIDEFGQLTHADYKAYYANLGDDFLQEDCRFESDWFATHILCPRNLILNLSSVVWRRNALLDALDRLAPEAGSFQLGGDWRLYAEACAAGGTVRYVAEPLNRHRLHPGSVTIRTDHSRHMEETLRIFEALQRRHGRDAGMLARMRTHIAALAEAWRLPAEPALERLR